MKSNAHVALSLAGQGISVIPCRPNKAPYISNWPSLGTTDQAIIRAWWNDFPDALPGLPTGINQLLVVDCDRKNGVDGVAAWDAMCEQNGFDQSNCFIVETPSSGRHIYFRQAQLPLLGNTASKIASGIDTRGNGGQVIAPGTMLGDGRSYRVINGSLATVHDLPEGLRKFLLDLSVTPQPKESSPPRDRAYAEAVLREEVRNVRNASSGTRNTALNTAAFLVGTVVSNGGISRDFAERELTAAGLATGLSEHEISATVKSGLENGLLHPRPALPRTSDPNRPLLPRTTSSGDAVVVKRVADVVSEPIQWLWRTRIAIGKLALIAGDPGLGKSQLAAFIASKVSTGGIWPNDDGSSPIGSVVMLSCEDDIADTIRPRLEATGADLNCVHVIEAIQSTVGTVRSFSLQQDLAHLESVIDTLCDVKLVVIDPISAYLGTTDSHKTADVRGVLAPLQELAARKKCAVIAISHLNKSSGAGKSINAVTGSTAFVAAARSAFLVVKDESDSATRLFVEIKNNIARAPTLAFRVHSLMLQAGIEARFIQFEAGTVEVTGDQAIGVSSTSDELNTVDEAKEFLLECLGNGAVPSKAVFDAGRAAGLSPKSLRRAAKAIGVIPRKEGFQGQWVWSSPAAELGISKMPPNSKDATPPPTGIFDARDSLPLNGGRS